MTEKMGLQEALSESAQNVKNALLAPVPGLVQMTSWLAGSSGKGIRARLLLSSSQDEGGNVPQDAPKASAAIELLHMATLVHDDVIDDAPVRRGIQTLHKKFDSRSAVICGDYLLSQAMLMVAEMDIARLGDAKAYSSLVPGVSRALSLICRGEYTQHMNIGNLNLKALDYFRIISHKTAALFSASASIGGIVGGEPKENVLMLGRFGRLMGMAFQIADDCKDYEWTQDKAQKPVGNDIKSGVVTLPLILAMQKEPSIRKAAKEAMAANKDLSPFLEAVLDAGGSGAAKNVAARYVAWAKRAIREFPQKKQDALLEVLMQTSIQ